MKDRTLNSLVVTESNGVLQVGGFVDNIKQKNAVEGLISNRAVIDDLEFNGRTVSKVVPYADCDCRASDECFTEDTCNVDAECYVTDECYTNDECQ